MHLAQQHDNNCPCKGSHAAIVMMSAVVCRHEEVARSDGDAKAAEAAEAAEQVQLVRNVMPDAQQQLIQHQQCS